MDAVEFKTKVKNGTIQIPEKYQRQISDTVKVILISDRVFANDRKEKDIIDDLLSNPIGLNNFFPFSREKIYERP